MAGLLDFLGGDDAQLGLGLLAAGGPSTVPMSFGQRLSAGVGQATAAKEARVRQKLLESQIAENASQDEQRRQALEMAKQKQAALQAWLNGDAGGGGGAPAAPAGMVGGADMGGAGGLLAPPPAGGGAPGAAPMVGGGGAAPRRAGPDFSPAALARLKIGAGVDLTDVAKLAQSDFRKNDATGLMFDNNNPNDPNRPTGSIVWNRTPDGKVVGQDMRTGQVFAAPNSVETFGSFQDRGNRSSARYQGEEVYDTDRNSPTFGTMVRRSKEAIYGGGQGGGGGAPAPRAPMIGPGAGYQPAGQSQAMLDTRVDAALSNLPTAQSATLAPGFMPSDLTIANIKDPQERANLLAAAVQQRAGTPGPLIGPGAGRGAQGVPMVPPAPAAPPAMPAAAPAGMPDAPGANVAQLSPAMQTANAAANAAQVTAATEAAKNAATNQNAAQAAANAALQQRATATASADVVRDTASQAASKQYDKMQATAAEAFALLKGNTTGSVPGAIRDVGTNAIGWGTDKAKNAERLEGLSKWLTQNVPRMEGPQSDGDRKEYAAAAGNVGDRTKPASVRQAALETIMGIQSKYADLNKGGDAPKAAGQALDALPPAQAHKGRTVRDTATGKLLYSDGMSWQPKKD